MAKAPVAEPDTLSLGALSDVLGFHLAQAAVFTYGLFERHVGEPFALRKTEYSMLMLMLANGPLSPKRLAQALAEAALARGVSRFRQLPPRQGLWQPPLAAR